MDKDIDLKHFLEVEQKYNLYEDTIEGIHYWVYSRFIIWEDFIIKPQLNLGKAHSNKELKLSEKAEIFFKLVKNCIINPNKRKRNVDILFVSHPRRVLNNGVYECIYTDKLAKEFENYAVYEQPYQWQHLEPTDTANMIYGDSTLLKKGLYLVLYKTVYKGKYADLLKKIEGKISQPLKEIESRYGFSLDRKQIVHSIAMQIIFYKASIKDIQKMLTRLNPKVVVEVVGYNPFCMLINEACRRKKIPTIELQHGIMNKHMGYEYKSQNRIRQFPNKIFLFSEFWKNQIHIPVNEKNLIATGYPYFERKLHEAKVIQEYIDGKINILFISQGTIGTKLSELAYELSTIMDLDKYRIFYKLHPGEFDIWEDAYVKLKDSNVIVIKGNDYSLYDYFSTCQIQVGVYSTALYEGLGFGIRTYIYKIEMAGYMQELNDAGYIKYFESAKELYENINENVNENVMMENNKTDFWKVNALENMVGEIKNIIIN